ncbi:hypothetical protein LCGC14_2556410, partial [marine sediment metagenome]
LIIFFVILTVLFLLFRLAPGDPVSRMVDPDMTPEDAAHLIAQLGLDQPLWKQYIFYLKNFFLGNFGVSFHYGVPVVQIIWNRLPNTILLFTTSIILSALVGVFLGKIASWHKGKKIDNSGIIEIINSGKIVGLMYGNSECGPRALGNRSIICDPSISNMKDILNNKVKHREWFRPFAPVVQLEKASKYFEFNSYSSPYMSFASKIKKEYIGKFPAINHVDNTARLQTVTKKQHFLFYDLLTEYRKKFNKDILLNTSFNIKSKPILTRISDAIEILNTTKIDYVVIEDYIFQK